MAHVVLAGLRGRESKKKGLHEDYSGMQGSMGPCSGRRIAWVLNLPL